METKIELLDTTQAALDTISAMLSEMNEISQSRSNFVLEHFVVGTKVTPIQQRLQILDELKSLFFAVLDMIDSRDIANLDLYEASNQMGPRAEIATRRAQRLIANLTMDINSRTREINFLLNMLQQLPKCTRAEIEADEANHWPKRLSRQAHVHSKGYALGMGEGNLDLLLTLDQKLGEPIQVPLLSVQDVKALTGVN